MYSLYHHCLLQIFCISLLLISFFFYILVKFEDGEWVLDAPRFVTATFLDAMALECPLPLEYSRVTAGVDLQTAPNGPVARWQIKVSPFLQNSGEAAAIL